MVPRTIESSINTMRLPPTTSGIAFSFMRTASSRSSWLGLINVRPLYRFLINPSAKGIPDARAYPRAAVVPESGIDMTISASYLVSLYSSRPILSRVSYTDWPSILLSERAK